MTENEILKQILKEFLKSVNYNKQYAEKFVKSYTDFCNFIEDNEELRENMYGFFYKLLDNYVLFKFYTEPIPALIDNEDYMLKYKKEVLEKAHTFFNFGGFVENINEND